ncbi:MAG: hypothetical protein AAF368_07095, partial [Planctomycetota bacterium]
MTQRPQALRGTIHTGGVRALAFVLLGLLFGAPSASASPAPLQGKMDQVFVWNARRGSIKVETGRVVADQLGGV